jgi:hypothetical protein
MLQDLLIRQRCTNLYSRTSRVQTSRLYFRLASWLRTCWLDFFGINPFMRQTWLHSAIIWGKWKRAPLAVNEINLGTTLKSQSKKPSQVTFIHIKFASKKLILHDETVTYFRIHTHRRKSMMHHCSVMHHCSDYRHRGTVIRNQRIWKFWIR